MQKTVIRNQEERKRQVTKADEIINNQLKQLEIWFKSLSAVPTIKSFRKSFHALAKEEIDKTFGREKGIPESSRKEGELMVHRLIHKLLHAPSSNLRKVSNSEDAHLYLATMIKIFELNPTPIKMNSESKKLKLKIIKS